VASYTIVGGIVGALGSLFSLSAALKGLMPAVAGLFMLFIGLRMLGVFPWLSRLRIPVPAGRGRLGSGTGVRRSPLVVGLLNGLMPCGPLQTMQVYALGTGSYLNGALSMLLFSLGTVPLMFGFGAVSSYLGARFNRGMLKASAVLVMVLGLIMFTRGLSLFGLPLQVGSPAAVAVAQIEGSVQTVRTRIESGRYSPFVVQKGVPVRWIVTADQENLNGCNNPITIPQYGIEVRLAPGENIIEFTPEREGTIAYTCWMGMISSSIRIVPDLAQLTASDLRPQEPAGARSGAGGGAGGCCSGASLPRFADGRVPTDQVGLAALEGGGQVVSIRVDDQGYTPALIVLQRGVKARIRFVAEQLNSCNSPVIFPEYQGGLDLQGGQVETPYLEVTEDFTFQCGMNMIRGYAKVVDDLASVDLDAVRREVGAYRAAAGGGCCAR
jgi:sulfite exporter TauE/SafE